MSLFRGFFGGGRDDQAESSSDIVERLVERVETSTALEDRRDALRALRSISKRMRLDVATIGMNVFMDILEKDKTSHDILHATLDILVAVLSSDDENTDEDEIGERLTEIFLKKKHFVPSVLEAAEQFDFSVRRSAIQLLTSLLRHRGSDMQALVMSHPTGVPRLVELLHESREVVRNESVLMLCELSRANSHIQQIMAYENAFPLLFDVIDGEPLDSIVIEDCLFVMINLLRKHSMNQQLFRENNLISRLGIVLHQFLHGDEEEEAALDLGGLSSANAGEWPKQRTANVIFLLQIIRSLIAPDNQNKLTHEAQKIMYQTKMLAELCRILLSEMGVGVDVLTESVIAVAEIIRGNYTNQEYFAAMNLEASEGASRSALIVLLVSMTAEKQPFKLRCAVFYCFLCYLYDNEFGKTKVIETLIPSSQPEHSELSKGALICQAISAGEHIQSWFGCISLLHCLLDVDHLREQLLRVQLTVAIDQTTSLLSHVTSMLVSAGNRRPQQRAGLLQLLSAWLHDCPPAVAAFTANEEHLHHLTAQMLDESGEGTESEQIVLKGLTAFLLLTCKKNIKDEKSLAALTTLLDRRVGRDRLVEAIEGLSKTEQFVRAAQKAQPLAKTPSELFLDFYFVKLFKSVEGSIVRSLRTSNDHHVASVSSNSEAIMQSFKDLIKRQDEEISVLKQERKRALGEAEHFRQQADKSELEAALTAANQKLEAAAAFEDQLRAAETEIAALKSVNAQWQAEVEKYKAWATQWQGYQLAQLPNGGQDAVFQQLQYQQSTLEQQLAYGWQAFESQGQQLAAKTSESESWRRRAEEAETALAKQKMISSSRGAQNCVENGYEEGKNTEGEESNRLASEDKEALARLQTEQEDLLVLLADQHAKISHYKKRLRGMGQAVSDDDDDDE